MQNNQMLVLLACTGISAFAFLGLTNARQLPNSAVSDPKSNPSNPTQQEQQTAMPQSQTSSLPLQRLSQMEQMLAIPIDFTLVKSQAVAMNGEPVWHLRYERDNQRNGGLYGEHISAIVSQNGERLKGFTQMDATLSQGQLPSETQAEKAAIAYLQKVAPDLLPSMQIQWIKPHDEQIQVQGEAGRPQAVTITGMKVKCYNPGDGRYFWVIVGANNQIITFERDIVWSNNMGRRETEKWLHDQWLAKQ